MTRRRPARATLLLVAAALVLQAIPAVAYLKLGAEVNGKLVELRWTKPVRYFVNEQGVSGVDASQFQTALSHAFKSWDDVPTASITYEFAGFTAGAPGEDDGWSTIGFVDEPDLDRVLASTTLLVDEGTGELIESDIVFNSAFKWSTAAAGEAGRFDVETIALHEIGHLSGLGHSAIGETALIEGGRRVLSSGAVMFPIAFTPGTTSNRVLKADDIAGLSQVYPDADFERQTGSISGHVTKQGKGVFGAHVVAFNPKTGALVGNFALSGDGGFSIAGLAPGSYVVRGEPIDDADTDSFFEGDPPPDLDFAVTFFERLVVAPRNGDSGSIQIKVRPK